MSTLIDRLSLLDEALLRLEEPDAPMHIGWVVFGEGQPPSLAQLRRRIGSRLELLSRLHRRVLCSRFHHPLWVDDPAFDLRNHVTSAALPAPGGRRELRELIGRLLSQPLDCERPLWHIHLVDGPVSGGFAIIGNVHHALVDGPAAVTLAELLLADAPAGTPAASDAPAPEPSLARRLAASAADNAVLTRSFLSLGARSLVHPRRATGAARRIAATLAPYALRAAPATVLNQPSGAERSVAFAELPLRATMAIGSRQLATVTDVALATATLALGRYLARRGDPVPRLRALVPVSTRPAPAVSALGNQLSFVLVELPVAQSDPRAVLAEIACQMAEHRRLDSARVLDGLLPAAGALPLPVRDALARFATRPEAFNAVLAMVEGPSRRLSLLGRPLRAAYPALPLPRAHGLAIGALSYRERLNIGLSAAPVLVPDVDALALDYTHAFDALRGATRARPRRTKRTATRNGPVAATAARPRPRLTPV